MVRGLDKFREYFGKFKDNYVIIGGTACYHNMEEQGLKFRATQDIDLVVILEKYDKKFNIQLWKFFTDGGYKNLFRDGAEWKFYRFNNPRENSYPKQIEILCRVPHFLQPHQGITITSIDKDEKFSHLSAIILDTIL